MQDPTYSFCTSQCLRNNPIQNIKHRNKKSLLIKPVIVGNSYLVVCTLWSFLVVMVSDLLQEYINRPLHIYLVLTLPVIATTDC